MLLSATAGRQRKDSAPNNMHRHKSPATAREENGFVQMDFMESSFRVVKTNKCGIRMHGISGCLYYSMDKNHSQ